MSIQVTIGLQLVMQLPPRYRTGYTVTRNFVDTFLHAHVAQLSGKVLDVGGKKQHKAGYFNIEDYLSDVEYLNVDADSKPDYLCSANDMPMADASYDGAMFAEVLEHLENPDGALREIARVIKPGGTLLLTVPFLFGLHEEPHDFQRWTEYRLNKELLKHGFDNIEIVRLGGVYAVLADILKQIVTRIRNNLLRRIAGGLFMPLQYLLVDILDKRMSNSWHRSWTCHYGVIARRAHPKSA